MVIVECVALAIMMSNDIVFPLMLQRREGWVAGGDNAGAVLLTVRRLAILLVLALAYFYYRNAPRDSPRSAYYRSPRSRNWRQRSLAG
jgi:Na+/proline symporter